VRVPSPRIICIDDALQAKRKRKQPRKTPYGSARDAIEGFATEKNFSTRINYDVLKNLGCESGELDDLDGLERFEDEKDDEDEKYDDEKEGESSSDYILNHRALTVLCLAADDNQVEEDYEDDAGGSDSAEEY